MLHKLSTHIAQQLLANGVISDDDFELYEFSAFCFLFNLIPLGLSIAIGTALNMFWKSILFIIPYVSIRTFSGGFHFKSAKLCFLVTNMILFFSLIITKKMICIGRSAIFLALILLASLTVFLLSPIDSDARKLTSSETSAFRRVARYLVITFLAIDLVFRYFFCRVPNWHGDCAYSCIAAPVLYSSKKLIFVCCKTRKSKPKGNE